MTHKRYIFGVDIGGTNIKLGLFNKERELLDKWEISTDKSHKGENILPQIVASLEWKMSQRKLSKEEIIGIGVGVPGPVDKGVVNGCVNLGWGVYPVEETLQELIGIETRVSNDAKNAALGELYKGEGKDVESFIFLTLGTGVGAGIVRDRKLVLGAHKAAGEIGHMTVNTEEKELCSCGKSGCLEQYASATGMVRVAKELIKEGKISTTLKEEEVEAKIITALAKQGDRLALKVIEIVGKTLGLALSNAVCVCDPEIIIIGGGVSKAGEILLKPVEKYYKQFTFHPMVNTPIKLSKLGNDAGIYGGASLFLNK